MSLFTIKILKFFRATLFEKRTQRLCNAFLDFDKAVLYVTLAKNGTKLRVSLRLLWFFESLNFGVIDV